MNNTDPLQMFVVQVTMNHNGITLLKKSLGELYKLRQLCLTASTRFNEINCLIIAIEEHINNVENGI